MCEKYKNFFNECLKFKKENKMNVVDFLKNEANHEKYEIAVEIIIHQDKIIANYLEEVCKKLQKEKEFEEWECNAELCQKYSTEYHQYVFFPKEEYRGRYFFAFVGISYDNKWSKNSFRIRLCGEDVASLKTREGIAEKLETFHFEEKQHAIDIFKKHKYWDFVGKDIDFINISECNIKNFIKTHKEIVLEVNKHLSKYYPA